MPTLELDSRPLNPSPWYHRYAVLVAFATLGLVFAGGLVTSKGAGLAVPDWPLSYGTLMPDGWFQTENVRAEHGHRMIAGTVAILTTILFIWTWRVERRRWVRKLAAVTLGAVFLQALFGGLSVIFMRPIPVTVSHALLGQTFFCLTVSMALVTSPQWRRAESPIETPFAGGLHFILTGLTAVIFLQLVIGAVMRHTQSGLAIHDFPLTFGGFIPPIDEASLREINFERMMNALPRVTADQVMIHFAHRVGAVVVVCALIAAAVSVLRRFRDLGGVLFPTLLLLGLVTLQVFLGALTIWSHKQPHITTAHVATGAAILATSVILTLQAFHLVKVPARAAKTAQQGSTSSEAAGIGSREAAS